MAVQTTLVNKPLNPRGNDQSPLAYNRAKLFSGKALDFDGVNDYLASGAFSLDTSEWSASMILKNDTAGSDQVFLTFAATGSNDESFIFYNNFGSSNKISFYGAAFTGSPIVFDYVIPTDYEHLTFTFASNTLSLYVNGVFVDSGSVTGNDGTQTASAIVGARKQAAYGQYFNGQVSGLKMYSTALTAAQVADLYNNPEKVVPTGVDNTALKLWLPMQEGAGTTAYDGSGNGNHGTISGATYVHGIGAPVAQTAVIDWNKGTNNQTYSEIANNAQWSKENLTITSDVINAPNGTLTADKMVASAVNTFHFSGQAQSLPNAKNYTASIYAKAAEYEHLYICLRTDTNSNRYGVKFDLVNGTYVDDAGLGSPTQTGYAITSVGDGWYRCEVTSYHTSGDVNGLYGPSPGGAVNGINNTFTGNDVNGIYIWGAQVNEGTTAGIYTPTIDTAQTSDVLLPQGLTSGRDITGVNLFENVRKQGALNLDGNSWAEVHDNASLDINPAMTMECWVNFDGFNNDWRTFFNKPVSTTWTSPFSRYALRGRNNRVECWFESTTYVFNYDISLTGWNHILVTKNGTAEVFYVNGSQVATNTGNAGITSTPYDLILGANTNIEEVLDNQIAQPRIYNRALTAEEVQRNYNAGKNTYTN